MKIKQVCKGDNCLQIAGDLLVQQPVEKNSSYRCGKGTTVINNTIILNGKEIPQPPKSRSNNNSVEIINDHVWVSGWYWNGSEWVRMCKLKFMLMRKN